MEWTPLVPAGDRSPREAARPWALWQGNPLRDELPDPSTWPCEIAIVRSGSLAEAPFSDDPRNWMGPGRRALEIWCDRWVGPLRESDRTLLFRPHARQVLSDVAGIVDFLRRHRGERFGIALAPADLLTPSILPASEELLRRALFVVAPQVQLVILEDLRPVAGDSLETVPIGDGVLPGELLREAVAALPPSVPLAIREESWRSQASRLGIAVAPPVD
jgi:hypothetical protein